MSNTEAPISITASTPDKRVMVTVRADNGGALDGLIASSLDAIKGAVSELQGIVGGSVQVNSNQASANIEYMKASLGAEEIPPFNPAPSLGGGRSCKHGKMTGIQGPAKTGGIYKGYFCPSPQGATDKCRTVYVNKTDPDWNTFVPDKIK